MISKSRSVRPARAGLQRWGLFLVLALALGTTRARCDDDDVVVYSMQRAKPQASSRLPLDLLNRLEPSGYRVYGSSDGKKSLICEVFWARTIRSEDSSRPASGILYENLKQGSLIGVVHLLAFQRYVRDYRSQNLLPGYYTMRYAVMPKGSDEKEPRDFVLLTPVRVDRSPSLALPLPQLVHLSRMASPIHQPVAMSLVAIDPDQPLPSLVSDEEGTSVLQVNLRAAPVRGKAAHDVPVALVVITAIPEDLGD